MNTWRAGHVPGEQEDSDGMHAPGAQLDRGNTNRTRKQQEFKHLLGQTCLKVDAMLISSSRGFVPSCSEVRGLAAVVWSRSRVKL